MSDNSDIDFWRDEAKLPWFDEETRKKWLIKRLCILVATAIAAFVLNKSPTFEGWPAVGVGVTGYLIIFASNAFLEYHYKGKAAGEQLIKEIMGLNNAKRLIAAKSESLALFA